MSLTGNLFMGGQWQQGRGDPFASLNPANDQTLWEGHAASDDDVEQALRLASEAHPAWSATQPSMRKDILLKFADLVENAKDELAMLITAETGKPVWESLTEVASVVGKAKASIEALDLRAAEIVRPGATTSRTWFRSHGVVAVLSPFNFPAHMGNGHVMPALLAGNCVVLKPSEFAPAVGEYLVGLWQQSDLPRGVLSLLQGAADVGQMLVNSTSIRGIFFTGSQRAGLSIATATVARPNVIVALEMGGNSPLVVWDYSDIRAAVLTTIQSTYITSGQRCSAARRLIVRASDTEFISALCEAVSAIYVGEPTAEPAPYIGPMINADHVSKVLSAQERFIQAGALSLVPAEGLALGPAYIKPGLIDVTDMRPRSDEEVFGPLLQVIRVNDFDAAIAEANFSEYGLAAGIVTQDRRLYERFRSEVECGIVNWNQQLTGASGLAPFGGLKGSGNHRPSGFLAVDYCVQAVASMEVDTLAVPSQLPHGLTV